jgi:hypothetical protein
MTSLPSITRHTYLLSDDAKNSTINLAAAMGTGAIRNRRTCADYRQTWRELTGDKE